MKRAICFPILGLLVIVPSIASADTVSIAGVTVSNGSRMGGISVRLSSGTTGEEIFGADTSSANGVFNLSTTVRGLQPEVTGLWVIEGGGEWTCRATFVHLDPVIGGVRRGKADDIKFTSRKQAAFSADEAASVLAGLQETAAIEVRAGVRTEEEAKKKLGDESAQILAKVPGLEPGSPEAKQVAQKALSQIDRRAAPKPYLDEGGLMDLTNRPEFRDRSHTNGSNSVYQRYLTHPGEMPVGELQDQFRRSLQQEVESRIGSGTSRYKLYVQEDKPSGLPDARVPLTIRKGVQIPRDTFERWLDINPEARMYLLYSKLLDEKRLPEDDLKKIKALREKMTPVVQLEVQAIRP